MAFRSLIQIIQSVKLVRLPGCVSPDKIGIFLEDDFQSIIECITIEFQFSTIIFYP